MSLEEIGRLIWDDLILDVENDRTAYPLSYHPSDPGLLTLESKTFYEPHPSEYINSYELSYGGKIFAGHRFSPNSEERFCENFLTKSDNVKKFKEIFANSKHPGNSNDLLDDLATSILVYNFADKILESIDRNEDPKLGTNELSLLDELLQKDIVIRAYSGISNIIPKMEGELKGKQFDITIETEKRNKKTRIRLPQTEDFPKFIEIGGLTAENQIPKDVKRPTLTPSSLIVSVEENVQYIPVRFHRKQRGFMMNLPNYYTLITPFDLSFQWMSGELNEALLTMGLLQSETCLNFTIGGWSIYLGERLVYNYHRFIKSYEQKSCNRFYEWNLGDEKKMRSTKKLIFKLLENSRIMRIYDSERKRFDGDQRLRNAYRSFNDIIESNRDSIYKLRMTIETLEKFYSVTKNSRNETSTALQNLVNLVFDDTKYIYDVFDLGYCIRSKYTHHEIQPGDLKECLKNILVETGDYADDEYDYFRLVDSLFKTHIELLRQTIVICLLTDTNADEFSGNIRTRHYKGIPKTIKTIIPEETYLDDRIKERIKNKPKNRKIN